LIAGREPGSSEQQGGVLMAATLATVNRGARFVRADLHIHSFGGSGDVQDATMTPEAIVNAAVAKGIEIIAITDHNSVKNIPSAEKAAADKELLLIPGVELSSPGGHFLVYAPSYDALQRILGRLQFDADREQCRTSAFDVLTAVAEFEGVAIPAHIDLDNGLERAIRGYTDAKTSVLNHPAVVALEIAHTDAEAWYTSRDDNSERKRIAKERASNLGDGIARELPKVQSSDAHVLDAIGRNPSQREKITRLKIFDRSWLSFRTAFADPDARVRIEEVLPDSRPTLLGLEITGGFLDGEIVPLSDNLTCIVGGRGSGKSTAFESVLAACGHSARQELRNADAWPERIELQYRDELGNVSTHTWEDSEVMSTDSSIVQLESLGQGAMARTIEKCSEDPTPLCDFFDDLVDLDQTWARVSELQEGLHTNRERIMRLSQELSRQAGVKQKLQHRLQQRATLEKENGKDLLDLQKRLAAAVAVRERLLPTFESTVAPLKQALSEADFSELHDLATDAESLGSKSEKSPLPSVLDRMQRSVEEKKDAFDKEVSTWRKEIETFVAGIRSRQGALRTKVNLELKELQEKGIVLDSKFITTLSREIQNLQAEERTLSRAEIERTKCIAERATLLKEYRACFATAFKERSRLAAIVERRLREMVVDMTISFDYEEARNSAAAVDVLKTEMGWRTAAVPKAAAIVKSLGIPALLDGLRNNNSTVVADATTADGVPILTKQEADELRERFKANFAFRGALEECRYRDVPRIILSRTTSDGRHLVRGFSGLSLGQQQSIIVSILLSTDSNVPLLIDQPEDNLDSAFVFRVLVNALRQTKERRQVILVTHNANITVLGDCDLVVPLKATADKGHVVEPGTVDSPKTRDLVCDVLEGGKAAYLRRGKLYGLQ
jgi:ABC-type Mn2+/Zn2+ transport system ATPase subunit